MSTRRWRVRWHIFYNKQNVSSFMEEKRNGNGRTEDEEKLIRKAFENKDWNEIRSEDSWMVFKVMAEFVEAMEKMARIGPCVSIFGSARLFNKG